MLVVPYAAVWPTGQPARGTLTCCFQFVDLDGPDINAAGFAAIGGIINSAYASNGNSIAQGGSGSTIQMGIYSSGSAALCMAIIVDSTLFYNTSATLVQGHWYLCSIAMSDSTGTAFDGVHTWPHACRIYLQDLTAATRITTTGTNNQTWVNSILGSTTNTINTGIAFGRSVQHVGCEYLRYLHAYGWDPGDLYDRGIRSYSGHGELFIHDPLYPRERIGPDRNADQ
jgi:hypothetical protein